MVFTLLPNGRLHDFTHASAFALNSSFLTLIAQRFYHAMRMSITKGYVCMCVHCKTNSHQRANPGWPQTDQMSVLEILFAISRRLLLLCPTLFPLHQQLRHFSIRCSYPYQIVVGACTVTGERKAIKEPIMNGNRQT